MPRRARDENGLSLREMKFCIEYLKSFDVKKSGTLAGDPHPERMVNRPHVRAYILKQAGEMIEEAKMRSARVIQALFERALHDPRKMFDENGRPKPIHELDEATAMLLDIETRTKGVENPDQPDMFGGREVTTITKSPSKDKAFATLAQILGLLQDNKGTAAQPIHIALSSDEAEL